MAKIRNSDLLSRVLVTLISITARRSSDTIACAFMEAIVKSLEERYSLLKNVIIQNIIYYEGSLESAVRIKSDINAVDSKIIGEIIESIIRILCMDLEEETGLFFIKEFKDKLGELYQIELKKIGVDLDLIRLEQKHLHEQLERRKALVEHGSESDIKDLQTNILQYTWDAVASFKYRNNICFLYDKNGKLLDKLYINKIIEFYIRTLTDFGKLVEKPDEIIPTEKEYTFLQMLYTRDIDDESAKFLLNLSDVDFHHMIERLLRGEFLQYISDVEIKLTDKGVQFLDEKKKQTEKNISA